MIFSEMKRRMVLLGVAFLVLWGGLVYSLWPREPKQPLLRLKVVRQTRENGRPVVCFRVDVADSRRIQITDAARIIVGKEEEPDPIAAHYLDFWAPLEGSPMGNPDKGRQEFGVAVPTNAFAWKLRVTVAMEQPNRVKRLTYMPSLWRMLRNPKGMNESLLQATRHAWTAFYDIGKKEVESDLITNALPEP